MQIADGNGYAEEILVFMRLPHIMIILWMMCFIWNSNYNLLLNMREEHYCLI